MIKSDQHKRQRSCVVCRKQSVKTELHRFVRLSDGSVEYDKTGRTAGRGAYVCSSECLQNALETKRLEQALRTTLDHEAKDQLRQAGTTLLSV